MDHETICDCQFRHHCGTFTDPLIEEPQKGPCGLGCHAQSDVHRSKHCKAFRCNYLCMVFSDALKQPAGSQVRAPQ